MNAKERARKVATEANRIRAQARAAAVAEAVISGREMEAIRQALERQLDQGKKLLARTGVVGIFEAMREDHPLWRIEYGIQFYIGAPEIFLITNQSWLYEDEGSRYLSKSGVHAGLVVRDTGYQYGRISNYRYIGEKIPKGLHINGKLVGVDGKLESLIAQGIIYPQ